MKARLLVVLLALLTVVAVVVQRQAARASAEADLWSAATDPIPPHAPEDGSR